MKEMKFQRIPHCFGCGLQIFDQYILRVAPDLEWHASCLKCSACDSFLDETCTCFVREGQTYCKRDYVRLFGVKCAKCTMSFSKSDLVMKARSNIYHIECFRCIACSRKLTPGDEFALKDQGPLCKADHEVLEKNKYPIVGSETTTNGGSRITCNGSSNGDTGTLDLSDINGNSISSSNCSNSPTNQLQMAGNSQPMQTRHNRDSIRSQVHKQHSEHKPTRVRTVLNEKQLTTLRNCYNANPRPDALLKERLVEMTGLSARVIRVWFQNKRCKDKKKQIMMKQIQQQEKDGRQMQNIANMRGIPLVATSPVRHESPVQHSLEVQTYHPPWKALADYASMQPDCDPNNQYFQHLVSQMHGYEVPPPPPPPPGSDQGAHMVPMHSGPQTGSCTPLSYLPDQDLHQPLSNLSSQIPGTPSELSSPCTSE